MRKETVNTVFVFISDTRFLEVAEYHQKKIKNLGHNACILTQKECVEAFEMLGLNWGLKLPYSDRIPNFVYAKIVLPYVFTEYDRVVYLDCDISIDYSRLAELETISFDMPVAMVPHIGVPKKLNRKFSTYYNSGVIVFNIAKYIDHLSNKSLDVPPNDIVFEDQCLLNILMESKVFQLKKDYNYLPDYIFFSNDEITNPAIIHHTGLFGKPGNVIRWSKQNEDKSIIKLLCAGNTFRESEIKVFIRLLAYIMGIYKPYHEVDELGFCTRVKKVMNFVSIRFVDRQT